MSSVEVRNYCRGEELPERLRTGMETAPGCDPQWIFIAERDSKPVGILVAAPAHIFVIFVRLIMAEDSQPFDLLAFLRRTAEIWKERGYLGYVSWFDPTTELERTFMKIIRMAGGIQLLIPQVVCAGRV